MLEKYLGMFSDEVVEIENATLSDVAKQMKSERKKILHFRDVNGYEAVANLWATRDRFARVFGDDLLFKLMGSIDDPEKYDMRDFDMQSEDFSLLDFPFPKYYEKDGGRYITAGVVFSEWNGKRNASFHRLMILDEKRAAIRLVPRDLYHMHQEAIAAGQELKIALVIGMEPNVLLSAAISKDYPTDELEIASSLKKHTTGEREVCMETPNGTIVPYHSEIVLEGMITDDYVDEGPFVDITGTYDIVRKQPVVVFEKYYHRKTEIFHLLLSGGYEHYNLMGMPREPTIFREIKNAGVDVLDVYLTPGGCSWLHGVVKIRKKHDGDGKKAIEAAFRGHRSMKHVVVVDEDIDIRNPEDVEFAIATRFQGDRDMIVKKGVRGSSLDPSSYGEEHLTTKIGLDATAPLTRFEEFKRVA